MLTILNKKSGIYGMSGGLSDFRDIRSAKNSGDKRAQMTYDAFVYHIVKYIGAYAAAMNGVDAITFTAGMGENADDLRASICEYLGYLGIELDEAANATHEDYKVISTADSKVKVLYVATNEELAIARETVALVK